MNGHRGFLWALVLLCNGAVVRADVTVHYKNAIDLGAAGQMMGPAATAMKTALPDSTVIRVKGKKAYTTAPRFNTVMDFEKQQITLIDTAHSDFVTVYMKDYADQIVSSLPGADSSTPGAMRKALETMKVDFSSAKTGKTDVIVGIRVEETLMILAVKMPPPSTAHPSQNSAAAEPVTLTKVLIHLWTPLPSEVQRLKALQELRTVLGDPQTDSIMNPAEIWGKAFASSPGMAKGLTEMMAEFSRKKAVTLRSEVEMFMPFLAKVMQQHPAGGNNGGQAQVPPIDPNEALFKMQTEADEILTVPIDDAVFDVPDGYKAVTVAGFLDALHPSIHQATIEPSASAVSQDARPSH